VQLNFFIRDTVLDDDSVTTYTVSKSGSVKQVDLLEALRRAPYRRIRLAGVIAGTLEAKIMIPSLFIAHGSPMVAIEDSPYALFLAELGKTFPRPKAIVLFSAHWESTVQMVSDVVEYATLYDFGGFPEDLYRIKYPAKGHRKLSSEIQQLLKQSGVPYGVEERRGLDHGAWTILRRLYPDADIPIIAMSVNPDLIPEEQYRIGKALSPLRMQDVLIIGSGVTVHNFQLFAVREKPEVKTVVLDFENWLEEHLHTWDLDALFQYEAKAPYAQIAVPPNGQEHFMPLFHAMGAAADTQTVRTLHRSLEFGIMTNSVYQFGLST